jgi:hypothetical protein
MPPLARSLCRAVVVSGLLTAPACCASRPSAPALTDTPLYENKQEGFLFESPDGWKMASRAEYPPGRANAERLLVEYRRLAGTLATLHVSMIDLPESADLPAYLREHLVPRPTQVLRPEALTINGQAAERFVLPGAAGTVTEVTAVRRDGRVYFFKGTFARSDGKAREQIRRAVGSLSW